MRLLLRNKTKPLPPPPTDCRTEDALSVNSSDDLSALLHEMETSGQDLEVIIRPDSAIVLNEQLLLGQGKVHKNRILNKWIACQTYLSQAEIDARARQAAFRISVNRGDDQFQSEDCSSRSGMTSRSSTSTTLNRLPSHTNGNSSKNSRHILDRFMQRRSKMADAEVELQGFRYESYSATAYEMNLVHDDSARAREDWEKLEAQWREALHTEGPKVKAQRRRR